MRFRHYVEVLSFHIPEDVEWEHTADGSRARFKLDGEEYRIDFETYNGKLLDQDVKGVQISFGTRRKGVFPTHGNIPFQVLSRVLGIIKQYVERTTPEVIDFCGESWKLRLLYERLAARFLTGKYVNPPNVSSMLVRIDTAARIGMDGVDPGSNLDVHKKAVVDQNRNSRKPA